MYFYLYLSWSVTDTTSVLRDRPFVRRSIRRRRNGPPDSRPDLRRPPCPTGRTLEEVTAAGVCGKKTSRSRSTETDRGSRIPSVFVFLTSLGSCTDKSLQTVFHRRVSTRSGISVLGFPTVVRVSGTVSPSVPGEWATLGSLSVKVKLREVF